MINEAKKLAADGRAVYIVAANKIEAENIQYRIGAKTSSIKVNTEITLSNFDWETMSLLGAHPNCVVLVDHYAIESKFPKLLEMLYRYDKKDLSEVSDDKQYPALKEIEDNIDEYIKLAESNMGRIEREYFKQLEQNNAKMFEALKEAMMDLDAIEHLDDVWDSGDTAAKAKEKIKHVLDNIKKN